MEETIKQISQKITLLRLEKGISERQLSHNLGHGSSYINGISSGKKLPSLSEFLYILEYFKISPQEFFDLELKTNPKQLKLINLTKDFIDEDLELLINIADRLSKENK